MLNSDTIKRIETEMAHYDDGRAASIEALKIVQEETGWVSDDQLRDVAGG